MVTDIELEAVGLLGTMCENKAAKDVLEVVFDMLAALDSDKFYQMTDDEKKQFLRPFVNNIAALNLEQGAELPHRKDVVLFASLLPEPMGSALDDHFKKNGWELQAWDNGKVQGYQVFFGDGVQVDNSYEYGFPYLYDKDELLAFAEGFYERQVRFADRGDAGKATVDELIQSAESIAKDNQNVPGQNKQAPVR